MDCLVLLCSPSPPPPPQKKRNAIRREKNLFHDLVKHCTRIVQTILSLICYVLVTRKQENPLSPSSSFPPSFAEANKSTLPI